MFESLKFESRQVLSNAGSADGPAVTDKDKLVQLLECVAY